MTSNHVPYHNLNIARASTFQYIQSEGLLPCLQTIWVSDRDSRTMIGRTLYVTSPIWGRIDWFTSPKISIVGISFAELEMDKTVHLELYLPFSGRSKHQCQ